MLTDQLLIDYKRCQRRAYLNLRGDRRLQDTESDFRAKLKREANGHVEKILQQFYPNYVAVSQDLSWQDQANATLELMYMGVDCIYQGVLTRHDYAFPLVGKPHLLIKQSGKSQFGEWQYFPISIQLGRRPKPEYKLLAAFYAYLLTSVQLTPSSIATIILRRQNSYHIDLHFWTQKLQQTLAQMVTSINHANAPEIFISRQRCHLCQWYSHCYSIAQTEKHLSLVPGVTPSRYKKLQKLEIQTIKKLAHTSPQQLRQQLSLDVANQLQQQALAILENRPLVKQNSIASVTNLTAAPIELYFDIEAEPERGLDYLLGVLLVDRINNTETFYPFLAETPEAEALVWQEFLTLVNLYPHAPIFHYSEYEVETVKRLAKLYKTPTEQKLDVLSRLIDLHNHVISSVIFPVESYSLKSLANWLGFQWRNPGVSGEQSVYWYDQWLKEQDRQLLRLILEYNEDDCRATRHLKDWLVAFLKHA